MAKVVLKSLEGGPKAVVIPTGKTVIGRGPLLGCGDKKVSRKHAVLEVTESGEIYLTPIHVNPCFYQPTLEKTAKVLKKDTAQKLEPGDTFSLLPRAFRYQVAMDDQKNEEQENKVQNNKESEPDKENIAEGIKPEMEEKFVEDTEAEKVEMEKAIDSPEGESEEDEENDSDEIKQEPDATQINGEKPCTESAAEVDNNVVHAETVEEEPKPTPVVPEIQQNTTNHNDEKVPEKKPVVRKRSLPEWLIKSAASPPPPAQSIEQQKVTKRKNAAAPAVSTGTKPKKQTSKRRTYSDSESEKEVRRPSKARSSRQNRQTRQGISLEDFIVSDDDEWDSDESRNQRSRRRRGQKRDEDSGSDWEAEQRKKRRSSYRMDSGSDSASDWETENRKRKQMSKKPTRRGKARFTKEVSDEDDEPSASAKKNSRRPCTYGKECYRKKTSHFEEFSHPGDSDYNSEVETNHSDDEEEEDDDEDGTPECPYGIDCYRKNAKHRKDYKHTKKVRPKREAAKKAVKRHGDDDERDSNMNDIDEEESDIYDPQESASDWEPEVDSDGDDVKRLLKEPKGLVQNKTQKQV